MKAPLWGDVKSKFQSSITTQRPMPRPATMALVRERGERGEHRLDTGQLSGRSRYSVCVIWLATSLLRRQTLVPFG